MYENLCNKNWINRKNKIYSNLTLEEMFLSTIDLKWLNEASDFAVERAGDFKLGILFLKGFSEVPEVFARLHSTHNPWKVQTDAPISPHFSVFADDFRMSDTKSNKTVHTALVNVNLLS